MTVSSLQESWRATLDQAWQNTRPVTCATSLRGALTYRQTHLRNNTPRYSAPYLNLRIVKRAIHVPGTSIRRIQYVSSNEAETEQATSKGLEDSNSTDIMR
jgi:hypothetical protein